MSQLTFYFFCRWNIVREPPPRVQRRQDWFDWHLLGGRDVLTPFSYEVQLEWTNKMFKAAEVTTLKKTHGRGQGSQEAERGSVSEH